ncbi:MAG: hypothetical protein JWR36_1897 [Glaciihabitans sp.]|nr:hypothetical protein [Glaciihabitans sp.]MDQ1569369.1 uncharacterized protein [Actinomycetota bacterium]
MKNIRPVAPVLPAATRQLAVHPIGIDGAHITSGTWAEWQRDNRTTTTPHAFAWLESDGTIDSLRRLDPTSGVTTERRGLWFTDSDLYKALEAVAWDLGNEGSEELDELMSDLTGIVGRAQEADGYINSFVQAGLDVRWGHLVKSHELYCIGHLIQAGIAHKRSTGRTELFDLAVRAADVVVRDFGDRRQLESDGHEEIEMALVELYRETANRNYLDLAEQFIDLRGHRHMRLDGFADSAYYQDATPVRDEVTVVGHAVRAIYLLAGVVDLYIETGEQALLDAAITQWDSMISTKTYLTGAVGSRFIGEAFGESYELPPDLAYGETCATIGNIMVGWRLLLATGESRFADVIERSLYNLLSASTSVDRTAFFYNNPAQRRAPLPAAPTDARPDRADAPGTRPTWFECACCPPNIMRTIASLSAYLATHTADGIQLHQYMPSDLEFPLHAGNVAISIATAYPVDGEIAITINETTDAEWTFEIRIPDWAHEIDIAVNGIAVPVTRSAQGYAGLRRSWTAGDVISVSIPIIPRLTVAHPAVDAVRGEVAIERGPQVYAFESRDQDASVDLNRVEIIVGGAELVETLVEDFLGQPTVLITAEALVRDDSEWQNAGWKQMGPPKVPTGERVALRAIPYALWANRGPSVMRIFTPLHVLE